MSQILNDRKYAQTHEWAKLQDNNQVQVGISDFAQQALGDVVYFDLPAVGRRLQVGESCATVESVKTASDIHSPVSGVVVAINTAVLDDPEIVNNDTYNHWLFVIQADNEETLSGLMDAEDYRCHLASQDA